MRQSVTKIIIIGTYFGEWPTWLPAFLLSCSKNETVQWLFFTDCEIPKQDYSNIRFEPMNLNQLNALASERLGFYIQKGLYSQVDLQPAYGLIFEDYIKDFDFWGHCDFDVVWGHIRSFFTEDILEQYDIISGRKDFLAGHLTLWRNKSDINLVFKDVPSYREILSSQEHHGFDEPIISTFLRNLITSSNSRIRVYWPKQIVAIFSGKSSPIGWYWADGKIFDARHREHIYLHFQHWNKKEWRRVVSLIDFQVEDHPKKFKFTRFGIQSHRQSIQKIPYGKIVWEEFQGIKKKFIYETSQSLRVLKRILLVDNFYWAQKLAANSINARDGHYDRKSGCLHLKRLNLDLQRQQHYFLENYYLAVQLKDLLGANFYSDEQDEIIVEVAGLRTYIQSAEEILELKRMLIDGLYNINISHPSIILDVGMNVGLASLFFASRPEVTILGYEPCRWIYNQALRNISLNPKISDKIRATQMEIGDAKFKTIAMFYSTIEDQTSLQRGQMADTFPNCEYEEIEVEDVAHVIDTIAAEYPKRDIILIVDLERKEYHIDGVSEYHMMSRLYKSGKLNLVKAIMMEWHKQDPHFIADQLSEFGFRVLLFSPYNPHNGMLYAVREGTDNAEVIADL